MDWLLDVDWESVLLPATPLLEIVVRGMSTYLALFVLLRFVLKRQSAQLGITDVLVVVLIADAAQNAMADDYHSVPDGLLLVTVIVASAWALDFLSYRFPRFRQIVVPQKLPIVRDGRFCLDNMRHELLTREEVLAQMREQGVEDLAAVRVAYMEPDGQISVVRADEGEEGSSRT